ncbi:uncharacterized protein LOC106663280 isoform X2 [Cimex lectularius]|uniref:Uncharacterized protein n=1 Tax=Cimex lectularius TaxID=79782 RepID=A0A8I6TEB2_CIMLE|nr:uncharacterized protein LOC106663280 isoform X2 [Cimex lectularius]
MSMEHLYWDDGQESEDGSFVETLIEGRPKSDQRPYVQTDTEDFSETISPPLLFADTNENNNVYDSELFKDKEVVPWPLTPLTACHALPVAPLGFNNFVLLCGNCACSLDGRIVSLPADHFS